MKTRGTTRPHRPLTRVATVAGVAVLALSGAACSSSSGSDASTDVSLVPEATVESTTAPTTEATPTTAPPDTTVPPAAPVGTGSPRDSATRLYDAWHADDRETAATVAEPQAVDGMWLTERGDYSLYNDCDSAEFDTSGCLFRGVNGTIQFTMERTGDAWVVIEAFYSAP